MRQPRDEAEHEKVHGTGRARRGQRLHADAAPEHDRIGDRIKLLENIGEQQRRRKRQKQPHRAALRHILNHNHPLFHPRAAV